MTLEDYNEEHGKYDVEPDKFKCKQCGEYFYESEKTDIPGWCINCIIDYALDFISEEELEDLFHRRYVRKHKAKDETIFELRCQVRDLKKEIENGKHNNI